MSSHKKTKKMASGGEVSSGSPKKINIDILRFGQGLFKSDKYRNPLLDGLEAKGYTLFSSDPDISARYGTGGTNRTGSGASSAPSAPATPSTPPTDVAPAKPKPPKKVPKSNKWSDIVGAYFPGYTSTTMKAGGLVRGNGCAKRGRGKGTMR